MTTVNPAPTIRSNVDVPYEKHLDERVESSTADTQDEVIELPQHLVDWLSQLNLPERALALSLAARHSKDVGDHELLKRDAGAGAGANATASAADRNLLSNVKPVMLLADNEIGKQDTWIQPVSAPVVDKFTTAVGQFQPPAMPATLEAEPLVAGAVNVDTELSDNLKSSHDLVVPTNPASDRLQSQPPSLGAKTEAAASPAPQIHFKYELAVDKGKQPYLQVPFSNGAANGLITIAKAENSGTDQLLLSPNNTSVFNELNEHLSSIPQPRWRLTDHSGHEQGHRHDDASSSEDQDDQLQQTLPVVREPTEHAV